MLYRAQRAPYDVIVAPSPLSGVDRLRSDILHPSTPTGFASYRLVYPDTPTSRQFGLSCYRPSGVFGDRSLWWFCRPGHGCPLSRPV